MKHLFTLLLALFLLTDVFGQKQTCYTPEIIAPVKSYTNPDPLNGDYCVTLYLEVDYDIYQDKGAGTIAFVEGMMEQVQALYAAQDITLNVNYYYHTTPSPYTDGSSGQLLGQFREQRPTFDGDVAALISYKASGGIAYVDAICSQTFGYSFSSINPTYKNYPEYSWNVEVIAHELGHNLGSPHTHSCAWNGNNTAIDGCSPFGTSGGCDNPGFPDNGGTVMSYCHLQSSVGINFEKGFHPQPLALIKNRIANAQCTDCDVPDDPGPDTLFCQDNQVIVEILLDYFPHENYWEIGLNGEILATAGPWEKNQMNTIQADTICLPDGCYTFGIWDGGSDGLSTIGCSEGMFVVNGPNGELGSGQDFGLFKGFEFCVGTGNDCPEIDLTDVDYLDYSNQNRDDGYAVIVDELRLTGNTWKAIEYELQAGDVVSFDYFIDARGEIQGIGFVPNTEALYPAFTYNIAGHQIWGNRSLLRQLNGWERIETVVPEDAAYIVFVNDHDVPVPAAASRFKNVEVCRNGEPLPMDLSEVYMEGENDAPLLPYPNPVHDTLAVPTSPWVLYDIFGRPIMAGETRQADLSLMPPGTYFLKYGKYTETIIKQ